MPAPKSTYVQVQGRVKWAQVQSLDLPFGDAPPTWHITIYPTPASLSVIRDLQSEGIKNQIKKDDENQYFVKFSRPAYREYKGAGGVRQRINYLAPIITDREGQPFLDLIGSGSDVTVSLDVYTHSVPNSKNKAKAARLYGVMIDNLIPYQRKDYDKYQEKAVSKMENTPPVPQW